MLAESITKNAGNEIDQKTRAYMQRNGGDYRTAFLAVTKNNRALAEKYAFGGDAIGVKVYDADSLTPAQREMVILLADALKVQTLAGRAVDTLARRQLVNVGRGVAIPTDELRKAYINVRNENPSLAEAERTGFIDEKDFPLLALLVPAVSAEVERGNFSRKHFIQSAPDVKIYRDLPTASIKALEIFATGTHNADFYSTADLDAMVEAFSQVGFQPVIKAGHADGQENEKEARKVFGAPALGYIERIYRQGSKLLADFKDIPRKFADLIKAGAYRRVSAEVYFGYKRGDKTFPRVLKAVAFLGASIPAIVDLKAIESLYKQSGTGSLFAYDEDHNEFRVYEL